MKAPLTAKEEITKALASFLAAQHVVQAAYLFGSAVRDRLSVESDIDIAILFSCSPDALHLLDLQEDLTAVLGRQADLVNLNHASPILAMQVLKYGESVFERSAHAAREFRVRTIFAYYDLKTVRKCVEKALVSD
jgi:predicted nucleotidyltransferase